jgi:hypothetical protein
MKTAGAVVVLGILIFIVGVLRAGADVTVHPKHKDVNIDGTFTAYSQPGSGQLGYELLTLDADSERQVAASGQEDAEERAEGTITIYNEYSADPVRLVKNTRFESPDGLVFRITESAVVPGYTKNSDGSVSAGTVAAGVFADDTGDSYNLQPTDFTVPGFKGDPEFDKVYAKSTEAFTGGFSGQRYIVADADLESAQDSLHGEIRDALLKQLDEQRPAGFIVFPDAVTVTYRSLPSTEGGDGQAIVKEHGTLRVPIFDAGEFAAYIAGQAVAGYNSEPVRIEDAQALSFGYAASTTATSDLSTASSVSFTLKGQPLLVWSYDADALRKDLAGIAKSALPSVLSKYPAIEKAEASIRPFWRRSFPDNADRIRIDERIEADQQQ